MISKKILAVVIFLLLALSAQVFSEQSDAAAYLQRAKSDIKAQNAKGALDNLSEAIRLDPDCAEALELRGELYYFQQQFALAVKDYSEVLRLQPGNTDVYSYRGDAYLNSHEFAKAIADYTVTLNKQPDSPGVLGSRGIACQQLGKYDLARADYDKALALEPNNLLVRQRRMIVCLFTEDYKNAVTDASYVVVAKPSFEVYLLRANAYGGLGENDKALADFNKCAEMDPNNGAVYKGRGDVYLQSNNPDAAIADYEKALKLMPGHQKTMAKLQMAKALKWMDEGDKYRDAGKYRDAIDCYRKASDITPFLPGPFIRIARRYIELKEYSWSFEYLDKALAVDAKYAEAYYIRGWIYCRTGKYKQALPELSKAIELKKDYYPPYVARAYAYQELGDSEQSLQDKIVVANQSGMKQLAEDKATILLPLQP